MNRCHSRSSPSDAADGLTRPSWNVVTLKTRCWYTRPLPRCAQPAALDKHPVIPASPSRRNPLLCFFAFIYIERRHTHTLPDPRACSINDATYYTFCITLLYVFFLYWFRICYMYILLYIYMYIYDCGRRGNNYILQYIKNIFRVPSISKFTVNGFLWTLKLKFINYFL